MFNLFSPNGYDLQPATFKEKLSQFGVTMGDDEYTTLLHELDPGDSDGPPPSIYGNNHSSPRVSSP